jgi:hypothetical protein
MRLAPTRQRQGPNLGARPTQSASSVLSTSDVAPTVSTHSAHADVRSRPGRRLSWLPESNRHNWRAASHFVAMFTGSRIAHGHCHDINLVLDLRRSTRWIQLASRSEFSVRSARVKPRLGVSSSTSAGRIAGCSSEAKSLIVPCSISNGADPSPPPRRASSASRSALHPGRGVAVEARLARARRVIDRELRKPVTELGMVRQVDLAGDATQFLLGLYRNDTIAPVWRRHPG